MREFVILTNRKRVIVALVHTVVFFGVALFGLLNSVRPLTAGSGAGAWALAGIYLVVTSVLLTLVYFAGRSERLYFGLCTASAAFGLARQTLGDPLMHGAVYARIALLGCAIAMGFALLRRHNAAAQNRAS